MPYQGSQVRLGEKNVGTAYLLFVVGLGLIPLHWVYLGKIPILRFLTLNFFLLGSLVDLIKIPQYVGEYNRGVR